MKFSLSLLVVLVLFFSARHSSLPDDGQRYPFQQDGLWGYIDGNGVERISARFHAAHIFSEGIASVREAGQYGYINTTGDWEIVEQFDQAFPFENGLAIAYQDSFCVHIDREGKVVFPSKYKQLSLPDQNQRCIVKSFQGKIGLTSREGQLVIDTLFDQLTELGKAHYLASRKLPREVYEETGNFEEIFIFNKDGQQLAVNIPIDRFRVLAHPYLLIVRRDVQDILYNLESDQIEYVIPKEIRIWGGSEQFKHGLATVEVAKIDFDTIESSNSRDDAYDWGIMDIKGNITFRDSQLESLSQIYEGNMLAQYKANTAWYLIDTIGERVIDGNFDGLSSDSWGYDDYDEGYFFEGVALLQGGNSWYGIQPNGDTAWQLPLEANELHNLVWENEHLIFSAAPHRIQGQLSNEQSYYHFAFTPLSHELVAVEAADFIIWPVGMPLVGIQVEEEGASFQYFNPKGESIYNRFLSSSPLTRNIDYMGRGDYHLPSQPRRWEEAIDPTIPIPESLAISEEDSISLFVDFQGQGVYVINASSDSIEFAAQDQRLYIQTQVRIGGQWKYIDYLPSSWCGNSYYDLVLNPQRAWRFQLRIYEGSIPVEMRLVLHHQNQEIYSNTYKGSINPAQLWYHREYTPQGIMDPYLD